jgi:molybdate transport system substrate-binding protein
MDLHVLSAGAARGFVEAMHPRLVAEAGVEVHGRFGSAGAIREKLLAGETCDVIILTAAILEGLGKEQRVLATTVAPLGRVRTGVAVRSGETLPVIADGASLRLCLLAATAIHAPDLRRATAGAHLVNMLKRLRIYDEVESRLRVYPNGGIAMRELAQTREPGRIGCTQITEIRCTPGVALVGPLPGEFGLATVYSVAVCASTRQPELALKLAELLTGAESQELRERIGFES